MTDQLKIGKVVMMTVSTPRGNLRLVGSAALAAIGVVFVFVPSEFSILQKLLLAFAAVGVVGLLVLVSRYLLIPIDHSDRWIDAHPKLAGAGFGVILVVSIPLVFLLRDPSEASTPMPLYSQGATPAASSSVPSSQTSGRYRGGWGPMRATYTAEEPAPYAVLNSITNNPAYGDERNFVRVRHLGDDNTKYADEIRVSPGDALVLYVWVSNNAADNLANSAATIHGLKARIRTPRASTTYSFAVHLTALNASEVFDGVTLVSDDPIRVSTVEGGATMHSPETTFPIDDLKLELSDGHLWEFSSQTASFH